MADKKRKGKGRAMPPPENPGELTTAEQEEANVRAGTPAAETLSLQACDSAPEQQELIEDAEVEVEESVTAQVKGDMVAMQFVKASLVKERNTDQRYVCLHLSAIVGDEAAELFSDKISTRYEMMSYDDGITELSAEDVPVQMLDIYRAEDGKQMLHEVVQPERVRLEVKEFKGSGEAVTGIRLSFVAPIKLRDEVLNWAASHFGTLCFVKMGDSQGRLKATRAERVA